MVAPQRDFAPISRDRGFSLLSDVERVGGTAVAVVGGLLLLMWITGRHSEPHGAFWLAVGGTLLLPVGLLGALAGFSITHRWRFAWLYQLVLIGYLLTSLVNPFFLVGLLERALK